MVVCEVDFKVSDWLTCISQRTKRTVAFCRRGLEEKELVPV